MLRVFNTLSRKKEEFQQTFPDQKKIRLFVCGPTVYDYAHIGHARTYIFFDFFAKYLRSTGYDVNYLQNITDVDDKIIKRATEENKKPDEVARLFGDEFIKDVQALGIDSVSKYAPATEFIAQIIAQVQRLIEKGFAYKIEGDGWYFDISKYSDYGKLSGRTALQAEDSISRIDESIEKRNRGDFCLWKFSKPGEPIWTAPIGNGRPGWHIEDTAISEFYFGPQYEIHGGGVDLKFPHHEAEIAQQESASGKKPFVKIWLHTGALLVDGKKMSKSLGNFITIREFLQKHDANVLRWITLTHHYRSPIDYSNEVALQANSAIDGIKEFFSKLEFWAKDNPSKNHSGAKSIIEKTDEAFKDSLEDDLHSDVAIAHIFNAISEIQKKGVWDLDPEIAAMLKSDFMRKFQVLGFNLDLPEIPEKMSKLANEREQFRASQQFDKADSLRREIHELGYEVEDTPKGPFLWPRPKNHN